MFGKEEIAYVLLLIMVAGGALPLNSTVEPAISMASQNSGNTYTSGFAAVSGPDGKTYYMKEVNGKVEKGVVNGPIVIPEIDFDESLPYNLDLDDDAPLTTNVGGLNAAIRRSVQQYLRNLFH